jgi:heme exporter protein A
VVLSVMNGFQKEVRDRMQLGAALAAHLAAGGAAVVASHRGPATPAKHTQTLNMDDYADAGNVVSVGAA